MLTVTLGWVLSGNRRTSSPLSRRYSVMPSTVVTLVCEKHSAAARRKEARTLMIYQASKTRENPRPAVAGPVRPLCHCGGEPRRQLDFTLFIILTLTFRLGHAEQRASRVVECIIYGKQGGR